MNQINWKRWLPTSAPLISGAVASAVVLGLRKLGIVVLPKEIAEAFTPAIAFLTAAIVHKPSEGQVKTLANTEETTLASIIAREYQSRLETDPDLLQRVFNAVLPAPKSVTAAAVAGQPRSNYGAVVAPPLSDSPRTVAFVQPAVVAGSGAVVGTTVDAIAPGNFGVVPPPVPPADAVDAQGNTQS